jgi:hypothetical protein
LTKDSNKIPIKSGIGLKDNMRVEKVDPSVGIGIVSPNNTTTTSITGMGAKQLIKDNNLVNNVNNV